MRLPSWLWKVLRSRRTKIALACSPFALCVLVGLSYPVCGLLGRWQVKRYLKDLEGAGYAVDLEKYYVPASSPDRDVFQHPEMIRELEAPKLKELWDREPRMSGLARSKPRIQQELAEATDVRVWFTSPERDEKQAAGRLLEELRESVEGMEELRLALERPEAAWQIRWTENEFTRGRKVPDVAFRMFSLRSLLKFQAELVPLHLADGDPSSASACVESMAQICRHFLEGRPSIVSLILGDTALGEIEKCVWEGVVRGAWTDGQLAMFEARLAGLDPQASASRSFRGEVAFARWNSQLLFEEISKVRSKNGLHWNEGWEWNRDRIEKRSRAIWRGLRPQGIDVMKWVDGERMRVMQLSTREGRPRERFTPGDLAFFRNQDATKPLAYFVYGHGVSREEEDLDSHVWEPLGNITLTALRMETRIALARTGIAVERYRLAKGEVPERLEALVPGYLPAVSADPFDGQPLRYRRQADGSPHLWSIGADGIDEGGLPHSSRYHKGDPVWITRPIPGFTTKQLRR